MDWSCLNYNLQTYLIMNDPYLFFLSLSPKLSCLEGILPYDKGPFPILLVPEDVLCFRDAEMSVIPTLGYNVFDVNMTRLLRPQVPPSHQSSTEEVVEVIDVNLNVVPRSILKFVCSYANAILFLGRMPDGDV